MVLFKCKMCGGALEINNKETVATCEYCGTQQTLPKLDDDRRANLYDRANHFRRSNEFDKAMGIYEQILDEDNTDAEAYWSLVLCRYGIEYVEDPSCHKRIPTINRVQFTSIFDDDNYKSALNNADSYQKAIYEKEAKAINEIQKDILAISQKEDPFDVFICYKETDNNGRRTPDSVLASDLYHQLTQEGFKVFFARITLEDKLGSAYEPYIFAALNTAKVMVVLGTKPEYFKAVWVRNEWSRYLALIKQDQKKMLIPAYKDMDPYDLPEEFSHLQAQDMSKLGFMQDLIRGIKKITQADTPKTTVVKETLIDGGNTNTEPLLKRAFIFLEDGDWNSANEYCERVLDIDPENAFAYLGKLLLELGVRKQEELEELEKPFDHSKNYQKAVRFADEKLKKALVDYIAHINARNENARIGDIYTQAKYVMSGADNENSYKYAAKLFESVSEYLDSAVLAEECYKNAEIQRKDNILRMAKSRMSDNIASCQAGIDMFRTISGWKDADEQIIVFQKKIEQIKAQKEAQRIENERKRKEAEIKRKEAERITKRNIKIGCITMLIISVIIVFFIVLNTVIIPNGKYNDAIASMQAGNFIEAYEALIALDGYKDSAEIADSIYTEYKVEIMKNAKVGEYVLFGAYEQDNNLSNGKEVIEWLVLEVKDGKALVISKYALACNAYNTSNTDDVTWETCTLRQWMNNDFVDAAFSANEKSMISTVTVSADNNLGNATQDQVFLLSIAEVNKYLDSVSTRQCEPTEYAAYMGVVVDGTGNCRWWLRSPGYDQNDEAFVSSSGDVSYIGNAVNLSWYAIRPALWIDVNS